MTDGNGLSEIETAGYERFVESKNQSVLSIYMTEDGVGNYKSGRKLKDSNE